MRGDHHWVLLATPPQVIRSRIDPKGFGVGVFDFVYFVCSNFGIPDMHLTRMCLVVLVFRNGRRVDS